MLRLIGVIGAALLTAGLGGCIVAPPYGGYAYQPAYGYGYAPGYYAPSVGVSIGGGWHR